MKHHCRKRSHVVLTSLQNKATPFHLAAKYGHKELVQHLCLAGCDINAVTENGSTADREAQKASYDDLAALITHLREVTP